MSELKRTITWKTLAIYGLGNILGAGIYVLIGEVAKESGNAMLWSFIAAGIVASFTALTYSALASEYPVSAGAAIYTERAFNSKKWSTAVGLTMALTAIVSASTLLNGFNSYFQVLLETLGVQFHVPSSLVILAMLAVLSFVALKGIGDSTRLAVLLTFTEAGGLLLIIGFAFFYGDPKDAVAVSINGIGEVTPLAITLGAFIAFYAFIGFEDMVNVVEEVQQPERQMKKGILTALAIAVVLYGLTIIAALAVLTSSELAQSEAPLATVWRTATQSEFPLITIIGLIAITNGALIGIITSSRIIFGLAREGWITNTLAKISSKSSVPSRATYLVIVLIAITAIALPLGTLARITSFILLVVFTVVHAAALRLKTQNKLPKLNYSIPIFGLIANMSVIAIQIFSWY